RGVPGGGVGGYVGFADGPGGSGGSGGAGSGGRSAVRDGAAASGAGAGAGVVEPWAVPLGSRSRVNPASACAWLAQALYCSGPGLTAARLDPADGRVAWSVPASAAPGRTAESGAPLYAAGLVLAAAPGSETVLALDPATGAERWRRKLPQGAKVVPAGPQTLLAAPDGGVTGLDSATGSPRWTKQLGGPGSLWCAGPELPGAGGAAVLYVATPAADGASTQVAEVEPASGTVRRQLRVTGLVEPVGVAQGGLFLLENDKASQARAVVRIDLGTQAVRRARLSAPLLQAQAGVGADGTVYVFGTSGALVAVRGEREEWRLETGVTVASRPVPGAGQVYLSAPDGRLLAVDAAGRRLVGQTRPRMADGQNTYAATLPAPVVGGDRVFATAPDGTVFAAPTANPASW
ncbi:outer membrane protein assembly factor BamB family protein, partial [Streptomyces antimicrobicus]